MRMAWILGFATLMAASSTIAIDLRQTLGNGVRNPNDFVTLYAGAICASHECNPYSVSDLEMVLRAKRGDEPKQAWQDQLPIYPPTTLLLLKPFAALPYSTATFLWFALSFSIYICGLLWAFLFSPYLRGTSMVLRVAAVLLGLHFPKMMQCLSFGNPSVIVVGLMLFAVFDDVRARYIPRIICIVIAVLLKATIAFPLLLLVTFCDRTRLRRSWIACATYAAIGGALLLYAAIPPGMHQWPADLRRNIATGERSGMSSSARISPSNVLLNVSNLPGYFTDNRQIISAISLIIVIILATFLCIAVARLYLRCEWNQTGYAAAVPAVAIMTLLPVYHRFCDIGLVLFVFPLLIQKASRQMRVTGWTVTLILGLLYFSWERRMHLERLNGSLLRLLEFLYYRGDALLILILAVVLVADLYSGAGSRSSRVEPVLRDAA